MKQIQFDLKAAQLKKQLLDNVGELIERFTSSKEGQKMIEEFPDDFTLVKPLFYSITQVLEWQLEVQYSEARKISGQILNILMKLPENNKDIKQKIYGDPILIKAKKEEVEEVPENIKKYPLTSNEAFQTKIKYKKNTKKNG